MMDYLRVLKFCLLLLILLFMQVSGTIVCVNRLGRKGFMDTLLSTTSVIECSGKTCIETLAGPTGCAKCCFQQKNDVKPPGSPVLKEKIAEPHTKPIAIGYIVLAVTCTLIVEAIFVSTVVYLKRFSRTNAWICKWWRTDTVPVYKAPIRCREDLADIRNDRPVHCNFSVELEPLPETPLSREESKDSSDSLKMPIQETSSDCESCKLEVC